VPLRDFNYILPLPKLQQIVTYFFKNISAVQRSLHQSHQISCLTNIFGLSPRKKV